LQRGVRARTSKAPQSLHGQVTARVWSLTCYQRNNKLVTVLRKQLRLHQIGVERLVEVTQKNDTSRSRM